MRTITLIPGDGIGPEVTEAAIRVVAATGLKINWERVEAGMTAFEKYDDPLPEETVESIRRNQAALKGPLATPVGEGFSSVNVQLREIFDLYLNFRPVQSFKGVASRYSGVDVQVYRENIEDFYVGKGRYVDHQNKVAELNGRITYDNSYRFFEDVFWRAEMNKRRKITVAHKANIFKAYHEVFLRAARDIATLYPHIQLEEMIMDALCMKLVLDPTKFDVVAAPNVFGDILSDLCAGFVGGLGLAPGANLGELVSIFEAVHGTWPEAAGKNIANPTAVILSAAMLLKYIGENNSASHVIKAVKSVIEEGKKVTRDLNPNGVGTIEMADAIIERMDELCYYLEPKCCA